MYTVTTRLNILIIDWIDNKLNMYNNYMIDNNS